MRWAWKRSRHTWIDSKTKPRRKLWKVSSWLFYLDFHINISEMERRNKTEVYGTIARRAEQALSTIHVSHGHISCSQHQQFSGTCMLLDTATNFQWWWWTLSPPPPDQNYQVNFPQTRCLTVCSIPKNSIIHESLGYERFFESVPSFSWGYNSHLHWDPHQYNPETTALEIPGLG